MFKKKMFSAALACGLCVALSMPAYGAEVRGDITSDMIIQISYLMEKTGYMLKMVRLIIVILVSDRMIMAGGE